MKIRSGFVSNSSSSSFVCCITGRTESGWDLSLHDAEMYSCVNGHTISDNFVEIDDGEIDKQVEEQAKREVEEHNKKYPDESIYSVEDWIEDIKSEFRYELPSKFCPVCSLKEFISEDLVLYLIAKKAEIYGLDKNTAKQQLYDDIRREFGSYEKFKEFIK